MRNIHLKFVHETHPDQGSRLQCQVIDEETGKPIATQRLQMDFKSDQPYYRGKLINFVLTDNEKGNVGPRSKIKVPYAYRAQHVLLTKVLTETVGELPPPLPPEGTKEPKRKHIPRALDLR